MANFAHAEHVSTGAYGSTHPHGFSDGITFRALHLKVPHTPLTVIDALGWTRPVRRLRFRRAPGSVYGFRFGMGEKFDMVCGTDGQIASAVACVRAAPALDGAVLDAITYIHSKTVSIVEIASWTLMTCNMYRIVCTFAGFITSYLYVLHKH